MFLVVFVPVIISLSIYYSYQEKTCQKKIVLIQPNLDPYTEKFDNVEVAEQIKLILFYADSLTDNSTDYVLAPETAIPTGIWLDQLNNNPYIRAIKQFVEKHPNVKFIIGANTCRIYPNKESASVTAHIWKDSVRYFDFYNSALQIDTTSNIQIYHKSKLVIGTEKMPFATIFGFIENFIIDLGGFAGSNGIQEDRSIFYAPDDSVRIAPVICYETVFGQFVTDYVKKGANLIFVLTNDGWWDDSPIYCQHLAFSRLRAIETRRSIARCANTGISCFINQKGEYITTTGWWKPCAISGNININNKLTFYSRHGDYIPRFAVLISILLLIEQFNNLILCKRMKNIC
ncbi:MAG: apolipoprotein N-acyltransferase [Bacteroidia bacterium]|nr:apolipoprotein N-acyltransferase [Bacteroidia bacterium]